MRQLSVRRLLRAIPIAVATAVIVPAMTPAVVQAQSVDQQRQKVEDIVDELERLEQRALQIGEDYNDAIDTKSQLDVEITDAEARIAEQEAELARLRSNLSEMALRSFVGGGAAPLGPLFEDSENLNDALQREELAKVALSAGDVTTDQLDALVSEIEDERRALDKKREQAEQLADSLIDAKTETEKLTSQYTDARADAEAKLGQLLREEEERRARESALRIQQQAQAASTASSSSGGGGSTQRKQHQRRQHQRKQHQQRSIERQLGFVQRVLGIGWRVQRTSGVIAFEPRRPGRARPTGHAVPVCDLHPRGRLRLLRPHRLCLGTGRRRPATPVEGTVRRDSPGADQPGAAG